MEIAPGPAPYNIAAYVRGVKVRIKSFFAIMSMRSV